MTCTQASLIAAYLLVSQVCACSPASRSPNKPSSRSPAAKCLAACSQVHGGHPLQESQWKERLAASEWEEESDDETWESESFESTLSSIAAFDMAGALERIASADRFYTPEAPESDLPGDGVLQNTSCRPQAERSAQSPGPARNEPSAYTPGAAAVISPAGEELQDRACSCEAGDKALAHTLAKKEHPAAAVAQSPSPAGSSNSDGGLSAFAWTAGRSMGRRHILVCHCCSSCARMPMMLDLPACLSA